MTSGYPNPTTGVFTVEIEHSQGKKAEVSVVNMLGAEILRKEVSAATKFQLDLSNQVSGVYLLKITGNNGNLNRKIIFRKE